MKLQLKRIVRTVHSEEYALFDLEQLDEEGLPASLGKLDLHYTADGTYGTLLLWRAPFAHYSDEELRLFVQEVMDEFSTPMGVPGDFLVECVLADEQDYKVYSNMVEAREEEGSSEQP
ncbi:MAG: hypothetical protein H5T68_06735 [Chloroflexi bacterium]|nr:hypothetical protein [Chloroflexota bacterium]